MSTTVTVRIFLIGCLAVLLVPIARPAHAYLDPGTGSMILQIILGGVAGVLVAMKLYWRRVKEFFGFSSDDASTSEGATDARDPD
jgi:flagellar biosynthesis protein FliR